MDVRGVVRAVRGLGRRLASLVRRRRFEREMDDEMRLHLDLEVRDRIASGMSPAEARRTALRDFGGVDRFKERAREAGGLTPFDSLAQDLSFGFRVLRRRPVFALTAMVTLAVGIAFTTAAFAVANAVAFRPVPGIADEDRVARLRFVADELWDEEGMSYPNFHDLRAADLPAVAELFAWGRTSFQVAVDRGPALHVEGAGVVGDYFGALGVTAREGRLLSPAGGAGAEADLVVVLSEIAADRLFGDEPAAGRSVVVNGLPATVVGVAANGFRGIELRGDSDLWIPYSLYPRVRHFANDDFLRERGPIALHDFGVRLGPGATVGEAEEQLRTATARLVRAYPDVNRRYEEYRPELAADIALHPARKDRIMETMRLLLAAAGLVLLVACANVANLLVFNGVRRTGESAVRRALGASGARLLRQHVTESALLAGGAVLLALPSGYGLLIAYRMTGAAQTSTSERVAAMAGGLGLDWRVLAFAAGTGVLAVLLSGLAPAWLVHRVTLHESMKASSRTETGRGQALRSGLTIAQIALSVCLVVGAFLLARTVERHDRVDMGFDPEGLVEVTVDPGPQGYDEAALARFQRDLLGAGRKLSGVQSAAGKLVSFYSADLRPRGYDGDDFPVDAAGENVTTGYFRTLGIRMLSGREFATSEVEDSWAGSSGVAIVNESLARELFGHTDVAGRSLVQRGYRENETLRIVGVAADVRERSATRPPGPVLYRPVGDQARSTFTLLLRSDLPAATVLASAREAVRLIDRAMPLLWARTTVDRIRSDTSETRMLARLAAILAFAAAFLAAVGLYALVGHTVAGRRRELGIRIALGARPTSIVRAVMGQAFVLTLLGVAGGAGVGWMLTRAIESRLYGVGVLDPVSWAGAVGIFLLLGPLAAAAPARSAVSVDPVRTLNADGG